MTTPDNDAVLLDIEDRIATITINRPDRLNALGAEVTTGLANAITHLASGVEDVRCVIVTGAGRAFCAGGDTRAMPGGREERAPRTPEDIRRGFRGAQSVILGLHKLDIPTIAMVNGDAVGGGFDLALVCDLRTAAETARFMVAYTRVAAIPGWGGAWLYPRRMGLTKAAEMMFTGDFMSAAEGQAAGFVNRVAPVAELRDVTLELARKIAAAPPISVRLMKLLLYKGLNLDLETTMLWTATGGAITNSSDDHREGVAASRERRRPSFTGR